MYPPLPALDATLANLGSAVAFCHGMSWMSEWLRSWQETWARDWIPGAVATPPSPEALRFEAITGIIPDTLHLGDTVVARDGGVDFVAVNGPGVNSTPIGLVPDLLTPGMYVIAGSSAERLEAPYPFGLMPPPPGNKFMGGLLWRLHDPVTGPMGIGGLRDSGISPNPGYSIAAFPSVIGLTNEDNGGTILSATAGGLANVDGQWHVMTYGIRDSDGALHCCSEINNSLVPGPIGATDAGPANDFRIGEVLAALPSAPIEVALHFQIFNQTKLSGSDPFVVAGQLHAALVQNSGTQTLMVDDSYTVMTDDFGTVLFADV